MIDLIQFLRLQTQNAFPCSSSLTFTKVQRLAMSQSLVVLESYLNTHPKLSFVNLLIKVAMKVRPLQELSEIKTKLLKQNVDFLFFIKQCFVAIILYTFYLKISNMKH